MSKERGIMAFAVSVLLILGMTSLSVAADKPVVDIKGSDIFYTGGISAEGYKMLFEKAATADKKPTRLIINSSGGPVEDGMDIGSWVFDNSLDILVVEKCMSSCANYIFPAARNKEISDGAIVAWHGSISDPAQESDLEESLKSIDRELPDLSAEQLEKIKEQVRTGFAEYMKIQSARQKVLFKKIGVDEQVTLLGPSHGARDFYALSVEDMKRFGITNIKARPEYTKTDLTQLNKHKSLIFLVLKDHDFDTPHTNASPTVKSKDNVATYLSSAGEKLTAVFDIQTDSVALTLPDRSKARLPRAISGSGARYADSQERMVFWEHQGEASLWVNNKLIFKGRAADRGAAGQDDPLFSAMDADNNGVISLDEFINAPLALLKTKDGQKLVPIANEGATPLNLIEKQDLFKEIDRDRSNYIDRKEWIIFKDGKFFPKK